MSGILSAVLVLAALIGLYAFIFSGIPGRRGRPPSGVLTRLTDPTDAPVAVAAMSGFALGSMVTVVDPHANGESGVAIGLILAITLAIPGIQHLTVAACGVVGILLAFWEMARFAVGGDQLTAAYRMSLMGLIFACFALAVLMFGRMTALRGERGLALFGLVELVTFLAQPSNRDSLSLDGMSHLMFVLTASVVAFAVGWAASEYVLGVVAMAVATVVFLQNSVVGSADAAWVGFVAAASAVALTFAVGAFSRPFART